MQQERLATADILYLIKEQALANMRHTNHEDVFFVITVLAIALTALLVINKALLGSTLQVKRLTIPSFFVVIYIVLMSLPAIVWFYAAPRDPIRYTYFVAMQSVLVTFPIGMFFANALFRDAASPARVVSRFFSIPLQKSDDDRHAARYWGLMLVAAVTVVTVYVVASPYVPLFGAFTSYGEVEASLVRRAIVAEGNAIHYGHALTARLFMPFCLVYAYFMSYVYGGRWRFVFWPTLAVAGFISALTFDRMFPLSVVLFLVLAVYYKHDDLAARRVFAGRRTRRGLSKVRLAVAVAALLFIGMLIGGIVSLLQFNRQMDLEIIKATATNFFVDRVLLDPSFMAWIYFEEFNESTKFMHGTSFHVLISWALGKEFFPTISPSFVAELWLNFGWFGVLAGTALVGFTLQLIQLKVFDRKSVPALSFYIVMLLNGAWIIYGHLLATMVISVYLPGILVLMHLKRRRQSGAPVTAPIVPHIHYVAPH